MAVFEYTGGTGGFQMLQDQVSVALSSIRLHQQVVEKTVLHERSVQERQATAARMESLSVLSGGVAHDLNNVLGPMVALPDVILEDLAQLDPESLPALTEIRDDMRSIKSASLRAAQTIKDLLTLGRERRVGTDPLDLNALVSDCLTLETLGFMPEDLTRSRGQSPAVRGAADRACRGGSPGARDHQSGAKRAGSDRRPGSESSVTTRAVDPHAAPLGLRGRAAGQLRGGHRVRHRAWHRPCGLGCACSNRSFRANGSGKRRAVASAWPSCTASSKNTTATWTSRVSPVQGTTFCLYFPLLDVALESTAQHLLGAARSRKGADHRRRTDAAAHGLASSGPTRLRDRDPAQRRRRVRDIRCLRRRAPATVAGRATSASPYDLLIVDMVLNEEQDGLAVIERVRTLFPGQRALIASGNAPHERAEAAIVQGLGWLAKPYTSGALARAVEAALTGSP